jgi:hypothetical protein
MKPVAVARQPVFGLDLLAVLTFGSVVKWISMRSGILGGVGVEGLYSGHRVTCLGSFLGRLLPTIFHRIVTCP